MRRTCPSRPRRARPSPGASPRSGARSSRRPLACGPAQDRPPSPAPGATPASRSTSSSDGSCTPFCLRKTSRFHRLSGRIMTSFASILIRQAREEIHVVNDWLSVELARERNARFLAEAEERRLARLAPRRPGWNALRGRGARQMFEFAGAVEREETWRAVWERLGEPGHPLQRFSKGWALSQSAP